MMVMMTWRLYLCTTAPLLREEVRSWAFTYEENMTLVILTLKSNCCGCGFLYIFYSQRRKQ